MPGDRHSHTVAVDQSGVQACPLSGVRGRHDIPVHRAVHALRELETVQTDQRFMAAADGRFDGDVPATECRSIPLNPNFDVVVRRPRAGNPMLDDTDLGYAETAHNRVNPKVVRPELRYVVACHGILTPADERCSAVRTSR